MSRIESDSASVLARAEFIKGNDRIRPALLITTQTTSRETLLGTPTEVEREIRESAQRNQVESVVFSGMGTVAAGIGLVELTKGVINGDLGRISRGVMAIGTGRILERIARDKEERTKKAKPILDAVYKAAASRNHVAISKVHKA